MKVPVNITFCHYTVRRHVLLNPWHRALLLQVIKCKEYYPFRTESDMLKRYATQIITHIPKGSVIVELGCGGAEKTSTLLNALLQR